MGYRRGKLLLIHCSVTDDDHFIKKFGIFFHLDIDYAPAFDCLLDRRIADIREFELTFRIGIDTEITVDIGRYACAGIRHCHAHPDKRFT